MEEKVKQIVKRVYPNGFTGNTLTELNQLLKDGWKVKQVIPSPDTKGAGINDWLLEKITKD